MPVPTTNELIRSVIRPSRPSPIANQWTVSLIIPRRKTGRRSKPSTISLEANLTSQEDKQRRGSSYLLTVSLESHFNSRRKTELRGLLPPPPISLELRGKSHHTTRRKTGLRHPTFPPSHWGFIIIINHHINHHHLTLDGYNRLWLEVNRFYILHTSKSQFSLNMNRFYKFGIDSGASRVDSEH
ncbi:hypothetical protein PIB30_048123 [Stylosanthes scabra]|uniref:Uncharacterized protein n=1 Tax=Stylosanthes scabra TaxID=79078 RepID=A0ABU6RH06_9FABA|nr:hypothetical protein [Stylosanthes scabra]